jgi:hypothetical protein
MSNILGKDHGIGFSQDELPRGICAEYRLTRLA